MIARVLLPILFLLPFFSAAQDTAILFKPDRVFDGETMHAGWEVLIKGNKILEIAEPGKIKPQEPFKIRSLPGQTLMPGMIEGHSHLFLHPYNETPWNDQVLKESRAERTARAVKHAEATLLAGFTTVRDLGTEGAGYDDAGLKRTIEKGVIAGPRMLIATRAIVATGSYGPKGDTPETDVPKGAAEAGNLEELIREARIEIGRGADLIKVYADYSTGRNNEAMPTFTVNELKQLVEVVSSSGRKVVAHASTKDGMLRAIEAGISTIEHGDNGDAGVFKLMKERNVALCPTLAAGESVLGYSGWKKGRQADPDRIRKKKASFKVALAAGVTICMGGDAGVFTHGNNALEMELMAEYGMNAMDVLKAATSVNADTFGIGNNLGKIKAGYLADLVAVEGNPAENISAVRNIKLVMKNGKIYPP